MLLDQDLPGLDGRTILGRLTDTGVLAASRVIMLTATRDDRNARAPLAAGAHDHLVKPASMPALLQRIRLALRTAPALPG